MGTYTLKEVKEIVDLIEKYQLEGRDILKKYLLEEIVEIYNGAGPDSWLEIGREILTVLMRLFKPVIMIHDLDFDNSDGTEEKFQEVTARWIKNSRIVFDAEYPLFTWRWFCSPSYRIERAKWWAIMKTANEAVSGESAMEAWKAACERRKAAGK